MNVLTTMDVARRSKMKTFLSDSESKVATAESGAEGEPNAAVSAEQFSSVEEFAEMTQGWPLSRLVSSSPAAHAFAPEPANVCFIHPPGAVRPAHLTANPLTRNWRIMHSN
jgi:hypothetical protein